MTIKFDGANWSPAAFKRATHRDRDMFKLRFGGFIVPQMNDLYIDKKGDIQRCKTTNRSSRAQRRIVLREGWMK